MLTLPKGRQQELALNIEVDSTAAMIYQGRTSSTRIQSWSSSTSLDTKQTNVRISNGPSKTVRMSFFSLQEERSSLWIPRATSKRGSSLATLLQYAASI